MDGVGSRLHDEWVQRRTGTIIAALVLLFATIGHTTPAAATTTTSYAWGSNSSGQLGNGTVTNRLIPTAISGGLSFTTVAAGATHACALTAEGSAYCWGDNVFGQLGNGVGGAGANQSIPTAVTMPTGVTFTSIAAGGRHTCALTAAGAGYCWGRNNFGQLGNGSTAEVVSIPTPVTMPTGVTFTTITAGSAHTCALTAADAGYCWGSNNSGQLGNGTVTNGLIPTPVTMPTGVTFTTITAGRLLTCALTAAGASYCWGENTDGQVGNGTTTTPQTAPILVAGGLTFSSITAGGFHTCALTATSLAYCWGGNGTGQLGIGTLINSSAPTAVSGGMTFTNVQAYEFHTCSLTSAGDGYCWGYNGEGQVGDNSTTSRSIPTVVLGGYEFSVIATGSTSGSSYGILRTSGVGSNSGPGEPTVFRFLLPDGRECAAISPMLVEVGAMVTLPDANANCRTMPGATLLGWTIPVPAGFTGFGSSASPFPPGLPVQVIESQRFTAVLFEPILTFHYDANVALADTCVATGVADSRGRIADVWVPRVDITRARFPTAAACTPPGHILTGWNTRGDGSGTTYQPGAALPTDWDKASTNTRTLFAMWRAR